MVKKERAPSVEEVKAPVPVKSKINGRKLVVEKPEIRESPEKQSFQPTQAADEPPISARKENTKKKKKQKKEEFHYFEDELAKSKPSQPVKSEMN